MVRLKINPQAQALSATQRSNPIKPYEEIAEGMEANFTAHMLAEMRKTVPKENPDSSALEYYNSLLDFERAQLMAKSDSGLGVKKIILDQIVPQNMKHYLNISPPQVRQGMTKENTNE
jgi:Rod binding domain-containing protein